MEPQTKPPKASKAPKGAARLKEDPKSDSAAAAKLAIIVRLRGVSGVRDTKNEQMAQMHLTRRYHACIMARQAAAIKTQQVIDYIAWGEASQDGLEKLLSARLQLSGGKKPDDKFYSKLQVTGGAAGLAAALLEGRVTPKQLELAGARPFYALHPPRKGLEGIKGHYPKQSLGYWGTQVNSLVVRMV